MKEGWVYKKLGEVCEIFGRIGFRGYTKSDLVKTPDEGAITLSPSNIINGEMIFDKCTYIKWSKYEESPEIKINVGDILIVKTASVGKTAIVRSLPHQATINPQFVVLKKIKVDNYYLSYYLKSQFAQQYIWSIAKGAAAQTVSQKNLAELSTPVPPLPDQQRIVSYLDSEFAKIEALKANAEKQLQAAKDLFQAALKELLTPKEGWEEKKFGDVCHYYKVQGKWENIEYIGLEHIEAHTSNLLATISANDVESSTFKFNKGDVLYGRLRPYLQKVVIAPFDGCCSTEIFPIKSNIINNAFLKYWLLSNRVTEIMINSCSGCRMPRANMNDFKQETIHYPQFEDQQRIAARLDALSANVKALQTNYTETITLCNDLKQALLKKVFG